MSAEWLPVLAGALLQLLAMGGLGWALWRWLRGRRPAEHAPPIVADGVDGRAVPLRASFAGLPVLPWLALAHNNFNPRLVVTPRGLRCRVLRERSYPFEAVEAVALRRFGASVILSFRLRGRVLSFDASLANPALAREVLRMLPATVPLCPRAAALLRGG